MSASGFTPISLYYSSTGAAVPSAGNLVAGELALNTNDGKLYYKNSSGVVTLLAGATSGPAGGSTTQVQYNNAGVLAGITGATTNGTAMTLVAPVLGTPASGTVTNLTGTASININGTVGATTANTGAFTTLSATGITTIAAGSAALPAIVSTTGTADTGLWFPAADTVAASTAGTERLRIDSSGNVGIGTSSPSAPIDVVSNSSAIGTRIRGRSADSYGVLEFTNNGASAETARLAADTSGNIIFANTGSVTERMRIDSSGNVGIGTSSPTNGKLVITGSAVTTGQGIRLTGDSADARFICESATLGAGILGTFSAHSQLFYTNSTEKMRIDASGNVGIGTSSPAVKFSVSGFVLSGGQNYSARFSDAVNSTYSIGHQSGLVNLISDNAMAFYSSSAERMRIDTSGNVGIGTSSPASQVSILQVSSGNSASVALSTQGLRLTDNGGNARSIGMYDSNATLGFANGTNIAFLTAGGSWQNSSDRNLKENFTVLDKQTALNKIAELPIMQWNYKIEPTTSLHIGPIAQDFYAAFGVGGINGETSISTIDPAGVALLGIQALIEKVEAQAIIITALTDRITTLEAKA